MGFGRMGTSGNMFRMLAIENCSRFISRSFGVLCKETVSKNGCANVSSAVSSAVSFSILAFRIL
jgi:hypothetical protein